MNYTIFIPILVFLTAIGIGGAIIIAMGDRQRIVRERLKASPSQNPNGAQSSKSETKLGGFKKIGESVSKGKTSKGLKLTLASAGLTSPAAPAIFIGVKIVVLVMTIIWAAGGALMLGLQLFPVIGITITAAGFAFLAPNFVISMWRRKRRLEVQSRLPDAVDLLEICVSCGMGLDTAWNAVSDEIRGVSTILADEMALTNLEIQLGSTRANALRGMAERTGVEDLTSMVSLLVQSERFGTSIAEALRTLASGMREIRSQRASENAEKMAVKLLFPMVLFIFPVMLVIMVGPAGIRLAEAMAST